jgi:hypothetical protein
MKLIASDAPQLDKNGLAVFENVEIGKGRIERYLDRSEPFCLALPHRLRESHRAPGGNGDVIRTR